MRAAGDLWELLELSPDTALDVSRGGAALSLRLVNLYEDTGLIVS